MIVLWNIHCVAVVLFYLMFFVILIQRSMYWGQPKMDFSCGRWSVTLYTMIQDMLFLFHNKMDLWHSELSLFHLQVQSNIWLKIGVQWYFTLFILYFFYFQNESHLLCDIPKNALLFHIFLPIYHWHKCSFYSDVTPN